MIHLDTSVLIDALTGRQRSAPELTALVANGERILISAIVLYEWLRGPRHPREIHVQEALFPSIAAVPFGAEEATAAANLYRRLKHPRSREVDIAIAACAITHGAALWTLNPEDFRDIPDLVLI